ncbi:MAG: thioredoxin family protein [Coxiellaceae bacterium]|nr:thioredoxin family protein [Coxiellaceae bacterium]
MPIHELTSDNFDLQLQQHDLLVIDFCADWCKPCKAFEKIMLEVEPNFPGVLFGRVNVEKQKMLAEEFAVRSVPYVMIIRKQTALYADSGVLSAKDLRDMLTQAQLLSPEQLLQEK